MNAPQDAQSEIDRMLSEWLRESASEEIAGIDAELGRGRQSLLHAIQAAPTAGRTNVAEHGGWRAAFGRLANHRWALSGIGAAAAAMLVMAILQLSAPVSAMERTARLLRDVTSYSYRLHWQTKWTEDEGRRAVYTQGDGVAYWEKPDAFHNEITIIKVERDLPGGKPQEHELERFAEIFPAGKQGVLVDYLRRTYVHIPFDPTGSKTYPWEILRCVREGSYDVARELGSKRIGGVKASGFVLVLKDLSKSITLRDPVELWVDEQTDLPLELTYKGSNEGSTYFNRAYEFCWNVDLDPKLFEAIPPEGFADITPPTDVKDLDEITAALRLYSRLSAGRYPQTKTFEAAVVLDEMKKLAGFAGPVRSEWARDPKHREIEQARAGLEWIERILRNRFLSGYRGETVRGADTDQVLLWWMASPDRYRVYYGDLRSEVLNEEQWSRLLPNRQRDGTIDSEADSGL